MQLKFKHGKREKHGLLGAYTVHFLTAIVAVTQEEDAIMTAKGIWHNNFSSHLPPDHFVRKHEDIWEHFNCNLWRLKEGWTWEWKRDPIPTIYESALTTAFEDIAFTIAYAQKIDAGGERVVEIGGGKTTTVAES